MDPAQSTHRIAGWLQLALALALLLSLPAGLAQAQETSPDDNEDPPAVEPESPLQEGQETADEGEGTQETEPATEEAPEEIPEEVMLEPTVVEAVTQKEAYGLDGLYQPGRTSFPFGGQLAEPKEVPFTFSVVDEDLIRDIDPAELDNISQFVPGVQMGNQNSNATQVFVSRGFQLGRDNILVNGMQQADAFSVTPKELVSEVEFYRGPSSILNGKTPPGGAANIVTKKPLAETFVRLEAGYNQFDRRRGALDLNLGGLDIGGIGASFRLNVAGEYSETFRDDVDVQRYLVAPVLTLNLTDRTAITFEANITNLKTPDDRGLPLLGASSDEAAERFDESAFILGTTDQDNEQDQLRLMFDASHRWTDRADPNQIASNFQVSYGKTERSFFGVFASTFDPATNTLDRTHFGTEDEFESLDLRLDTTFEIPTGPLTNRGVVGFQYRDFERRDLFTGFATNADSVNIFDPDPDLPFQGFGPGRGLEGDEESIEGFFQNEFALTEGPLKGFRLVAGGRVVAFDNELDPAQDETEFTPRVGLGYTPPAAEWVTVFGNYAESFDPQGGVTAGGDALGPQEGRQFEFGAKFLFLEERVSASVVYFNLENQDVGVSDPDNPGASIAIGEQNNQGLELEVIGEILPNFQLYGQYTFNDSEIEDDPALSGNELALTPEHSASLWLRYDFPQMTNPLVNKPTDRLTVGGGVVYVGDRFATVSNAIELTSYARVDLMARYVFNENTTAQVNIMNLTDQRYFTGGNTFGGSVTPGQPLTVAFEIAHTF
jgi:iron complex outermembrane receptor protein